MEKTNDELFAATANEIERLLNSKTVVGAPIVVKDTTIVPLVSIGFGLGYGSGNGNDTKVGAGGVLGVGAGGGIKPVAVLIVDGAGARLETLKGGAATALEKVAEGIGRAMDKRKPGKPLESG